MTQKLCQLLLIFVTLSIALPKKAAAIPQQGLGRERSCSASTGKVDDPIDWNPTGGGKDVEFVMTNPVCASIFAVQYLDTKLSIYAMNQYCGNGGPPRIAPSPLQDSIDLIKATYKCGSNPSANVSCCAAYGNAARSLGQFLAYLSTIHDLAQNTYENTRVCGAEWMKPNPNKYDFSAADYKQKVQNKINRLIRENSLKLGKSCLKSNDDDDEDCKLYREWFFGGQEYTDNPYQGSTCVDPTRAKDQYGNYPPQRYYLKGTESGNYNCKQYLILPGQSNPNNYNLADMKTAHECCMNRSQNYMCIDYTNYLAIENPPMTMKRTPTFCKKGENCTMMRPAYNSGDSQNKGNITIETEVATTTSAYDFVTKPQMQNGSIWFTVKSADSEGRLLCAQTYSLCPYNFYVGGGADSCDYYRDGKYDKNSGTWKIITQEQIDKGQCSQNSEVRNDDCTYNDKVGKCRNYCQYLVHCTKTSSDNFYYQSGLGSPYFAQACRDFTGDSRNNTGYDGGVVFGKQVHFTAPIAQCIKETLENLFYNRAGHSVCATYGEQPDINGICASGVYATDNIQNPDGSSFQFIYKKGNQVKARSFFKLIQDTMSFVIKLGITLAVTIYGINLLLFKNDLGDKKDILVFIFKIALVMYFCIGTAWQDIFFRGFYDASMSLAQIMFKVGTPSDPHKQDGCQFGDVTLADGTNKTFSLYPEGKSYLAIWDTIDCKMMRYLGFGPQLSDANIAGMVISSYFIGPIGIYFAISVMIFGFFLISLGIRALHIFISSAAAIILLVFISPVVIPCVMFERTKGIFDGWLGKMISYCLQPMILFAYVAIFITVMDQTLIGSATFHGDSNPKTMSCAESCYDSNGNLVPYTNNDQAPACDQLGQKLVNPLDDSVACMLNFREFGSWNAFAVIGVAMPMLENLLDKDHAKERILNMIKAALIMFLLYKFVDEISDITDSLVGGGLSSKGEGAFNMLRSTIGATSGISKRLASLGDRAAKSTLSTLSKNVQRSGSQGKQVADVGKGASDQVGSLGGSSPSNNVTGRGGGADKVNGGSGASDSARSSNK